MRGYDKVFKEEAIRLSDEIGLKKAAEQLGIPYFTLQGWKNKNPNTVTEPLSGAATLMLQSKKRRAKSNWKEKTMGCGAPMKSSRMRSLFSQKTGSVEGLPYLCLHPSTAGSLDRQGNVQSTGCQ
jgi:transposase